MIQALGGVEGIFEHKLFRERTFYMGGSVLEKGIWI